MYVNKILSTGEDGFIISKNEIKDETFYSLVCHGFVPGFHFYHKI